VKRLVLGVIGHVDHGKTALVRALTGIDTDRLPEEKRRGISIALGFAHLALPDATVDLVDMPGHERFVRTMVSGATGIDAALLVVAANEGVMPQTVEHVDIAAVLGIERALIAVTKADLAPEAAIQVGEAASGLLRQAGIAPVGSVLTSAARGTGIAALKDAIAGFAATERASDGLAFMPVDRAFTIAGHGTVVTGTLRGAPIAAGDTLDLQPSGRLVRVRSVQVRGASVTRAAPGQRVAINLRDVSVDEAKRAASLSAPGSLAPAAWLAVRLRAVESAPTLANGSRLRALLGTTELDVRLRLLDRDALAAGESGFAQLHCAEPVAIPVREHFVLRLPSPARTVAGGVVLEAVSARRRWRDPAVLERLAELAQAAPDAILRGEVARAGMAGTNLSRLSRLTALAPDAVVRGLAGTRVIIGRQQLVVSQEAVERVRKAAMSALEKVAGLSRERLLREVPGASAAVLDEALLGLLVANLVVEGLGGLTLRRLNADRDRARAQAALSAELERALRDGGLTPPEPAALADGLERKRALDQLLRAGTIVRARDTGQKRDMLFHQEAIEDAQRRLSPLLAQPPGLLVSDVGAALGISRKFSVPLLEHLDQIRFTRRIQNRRILAR